MVWCESTLTQEWVKSLDLSIFVNLYGAKSPSLLMAGVLLTSL